MTKLSKTNKIEVPLVQDDLKYSDTLIQIANTLDILDQAVHNVFDHVRTSLGKTKESLHAIEQRSHVVSEKIEQLKSIKKTVTILSKGKYPYESSHGNNYVIDFTVAPKLSLPRPPACESQSRELSGDIENKLKFFYVKTDDMLRRNTDLVCEESLGPLPSTIDSVTSCLLFNTCENVYEQYVIVDPLSSGRSKVSQDRGGGDSTPLRKMEDAPKSLNMEDDLLIRSQPYTFSPTVESIPEILLPTDLPDLVGFADDFRYIGDVETPTMNISAAVTTKPVDQPSPAPAVPTPHIPKPPSQPVTPSQSVTPTPTAPTSVTSPPPPPPPPPRESTTMSKVTESTNAASDVPSSLHANLMDAIRSAGGTSKAKLRSVASEISTSTAPTVAAQTKPPAGDLMSDLAAKLSLRRKGISGSQQVKEGGSIMDKLLASIPPPPQRQESSESEASDNTEPEWDE